MCIEQPDYIYASENLTQQC